MCYAGYFATVLDFVWIEATFTQVYFPFRFSYWYPSAASAVAMSDSDGQGSEPAGLEGLPPMYSIAKGEVVSVQTYGAFVRLPGYKKEGQQKLNLSMWIIYVFGNILITIWMHILWLD